MAIRYVNALSHYTDWTIGHVSRRRTWVERHDHFWSDLLYGSVAVEKNKTCIPCALWNGISGSQLLALFFYAVAMWFSGIMQGVMWRTYNDLGFLEYSFIETVKAMKPFLYDPCFGWASLSIGYVRADL